MYYIWLLCVSFRSSNSSFYFRKIFIYYILNIHFIVLFFCFLFQKHNYACVRIHLPIFHIYHCLFFKNISVLCLSTLKVSSGWFFISLSFVLFCVVAVPSAMTFFFFFSFGHAAQLAGFSFLTWDWTRATAVRAPSPNHWTTREFPWLLFFHSFSELLTPTSLFFAFFVIFYVLVVLFFPHSFSLPVTLKNFFVFLSYFLW